MEYRQAKIQILDLPGIVKGASSGRGRGREVISVIRSCDLVVMIIDVFNYQQLKVLEDELYDAGIRINQTPPDVTLTKLVKGGITITSTCRAEHRPRDHQDHPGRIQDAQRARQHS